VGEQYETYGYEESDYVEDFGRSDIDEDYDLSSDEPIAFEGSGSVGGIREGVGNVTREEPLRATKPQGSSEGAVGVGASGRGGTAPMPSTPVGTGVGSGIGTGVGSGFSGGPSSKPGQG
jgi:hypothetical protein